MSVPSTPILVPRLVPEPPRTALILGSLMVVMALAALDNNIVNTALPTIAATLGGLDHLSWIVTAFMLASTVTMPLYGKLSDMHGRRPMFTIAILIFLLGSVLCGLAQTMGQLILFRMIQGIGAGGLVPLVMATIGDIVAPRERGRFQGLFIAVFGAAGLAGPVLGGLLTEMFGWRAIFYVNLPIGALALLLLRAYLPASVRRRHAIDYGGATLVLASAAPLLLALSWGGRTIAWLSPTMVAMLAIAMTAAAWLYRHEQRSAEPVIAVHLFPNPVYRRVLIVLSGIGLGFFGSMVFLPLFLQQARGLSPAQSGLMILPLIAGNVLAAIVGGRIVSRVGRYRLPLVAGMAMVTTGLLLLALLIHSDAGLLPIGAMLFFTGMGGGLGIPQLTVAAQNVVEPRDMGTATATLQFFNALAGSSGVALAGAILTARLAGSGYSGAIGAVCLVGALICGAAFLVSLTIPDLELRGR